jgi:hypothetical protein
MKMSRVAVSNIYHEKCRNVRVFIAKTHQALGGHEPHRKDNAIDSDDTPEHRVLRYVI